MATDNLPVVLKKTAEEGIVTYARMAQDLLLSQYSLRSYMIAVDQAYMRETDYTDAEWKSRLANRAGDSNKIQNVTVPIVMPQVEAAMGYMTNVFCTGQPVFGVTADPQFEDAALQMETIISENSIRAGWVRQLMLFFRDGLKYNLHAIEAEWQQRTTYTVETDAVSSRGAKPKEVLWNGNVLRRMDMYNTFFDPRVHPAEIHEHGEYAGYIEVFSRIRLKKWINERFGHIPAAVVKRAFESAPLDISYSGGTPSSYYIPLINPFPLMNQAALGGFDWTSWVSNVAQRPGSIRYNNAYQIMKLYARIIPSDFGLDVPDANTPQVWKFYLINNTVVLWSERQTNAHDYIPIFFGQPLEDGLDFQTKSFATNVVDMQSVASGFWNGYIASKRRLVTDRVLYDPMRINKKDISSTDPAAKIPVRPAAFGKNVSEAVYQFPFKDNEADSLLNGATLVQRFADMINGQNPAQQGQFVKGNKTKHEYDDVMGHGNNKNQTMALMTEFQVFVPMKEAIKLNILQYQEDGVTLFNTAQKSNVKVNTTELRKAAVHFDVSDGIMPSDKLMNGDEWNATMQAISQPGSPIGAGYNVAPMFTYLSKTRGVDLTPFEKSPLQLQFEQQQQAWQQVAEAAIKAGQPVPPQPQMPPELVQQLQATQKLGGTPPSKGSSALEGTQGSSPVPQPTQQSGNK